MKETPVARIEIDYWGAASILIRVTDGVYICTCSVRSDEYTFKTLDVFISLGQDSVKLRVICQ